MDIGNNRARSSKILPEIPVKSRGLPPRHPSLQTQVAFELLEVGQTLCDETGCDVCAPQGSLYYDTHHLNELGANRVVQGFFSK